MYPLSTKNQMNVLNCNYNYSATNLNRKKMFSSKNN